MMAKVDPSKALYALGNNQKCSGNRMKCILYITINVHNPQKHFITKLVNGLEQSAHNHAATVQTAM